MSKRHKQTIMDHVEKRGSITANMGMHVLEEAYPGFGTIDDVDSTLSELAGEGKLFEYAGVHRLPYGCCDVDTDFTIGECPTLEGGSFFGIIWYTGEESWCWGSYAQALGHARETAIVAANRA